MTLGALAFLRAARKLAIVIVLVAVHTVCDRQRLFEIAIYMTRRAGDRRMLAR